MGLKHDPVGAAKLRTFYFSAWVKPHGHEDDCVIPPGEVRRPDRWQQLVCVPPTEAYGLLLAFLERAAKEGRLLSGVLISADPEEERSV